MANKIHLMLKSKYVKLSPSNKRVNTQTLMGKSKYSEDVIYKYKNLRRNQKC